MGRLKEEREKGFGQGMKGENGNKDFVNGLKVGEGNGKTLYTGTTYYTGTNSPVMNVIIMHGT